jgi:hypothetical protein
MAGPRLCGTESWNHIDIGISFIGPIVMTWEGLAAPIHVPSLPTISVFAQIWICQFSWKCQTLSAPNLTWRDQDVAQRAETTLTLEYPSLDPQWWHEKGWQHQYMCHPCQQSQSLLHLLMWFYVVVPNWKMLQKSFYNRLLLFDLFTVIM